MTAAPSAALPSRFCHASCWTTCRPRGGCARAVAANSLPASAMMNAPLEPPAARRPLKSRSQAWAGAVSRALLRFGLRPNQVSVLSVLFALGALGCFLAPSPGVAHWLVAAACIQLRLLCNLMDGMLAVEGGLKSPSGDLYNEFPDRLADVLILAGLGHAGDNAIAETLGWIAACGALMTACVRAHGASLTGHHDYRGPMAKPHRMALATLICLLMAGLVLVDQTAPVVRWGLALMTAGIGLTLVRRLRALARTLHERAAS